MTKSPRSVLFSLHLFLFVLSFARSNRNVTQAKISLLIDTIAFGSTASPEPSSQ